MHLDTGTGEQFDHPLTGYAIKEGAIGNRCVDFAIFYIENIGGGQFGNIA